MNLKKFFSISKIVQAITALFVFVGIIYGIFEFFFKPADVEVLFSFNDADLPSSIAKMYSDSYKPLIEIIKKNDKQLESKLVELNYFFNQTREKVKFEISNNSDKTINNVDIRIINIEELTAYGVTGNILQSVESLDIMRKMKEDKLKGIITFSGIEKLPPKSTLIINIWGEIRYSAFEYPIIVTYDGGTGKVLKTSVVKGIDSFVYENSEFLLLLLCVFNIGLFLFFFEKLCKKNRNE